MAPPSGHNSRFDNMPPLNDRASTYQSDAAKETLRDTRLVNDVLRRLNERSRLSALASSVLKGIRDAATPAAAQSGDGFVGEELGTTICGKSKPGQEGRFDCADDSFDCAEFGGNFRCAAGIEYAHCGDETATFGCKKDFDCGKDAFDCFEFGCGDPGTGVGGYNCNEDVDFLCTGFEDIAFDCVDKFDCAAKHIFWCSEDHDCKDSFTCNSPGMGEGDNNKCVNPYPYNPPPPNDSTPGDFLCGMSQTADKFDCLDTFDCKGVDDFACEEVAIFNCGDGVGTDKFDCSNQFDCREDAAATFTCRSQVNCGTYFQYTPTS